MSQQPTINMEEIRKLQGELNGIGSLPFQTQNLTQLTNNQHQLTNTYKRLSVLIKTASDTDISEQIGSFWIRSLRNVKTRLSLFALHLRS